MVYSFGTCFGAARRLWWQQPSRYGLDAPGAPPSTQLLLVEWVATVVKPILDLNYWIIIGYINFIIGYINYLLLDLNYWDGLSTLLLGLAKTTLPQPIWMGLCYCTWGQHCWVALTSGWQTRLHVVQKPCCSKAWKGLRTAVTSLAPAGTGVWGCGNSGVPDVGFPEKAKVPSIIYRYQCCYRFDVSLEVFQWKKRGKGWTGIFSKVL